MHKRFATSLAVAASMLAAPAAGKPAHGVGLPVAASSALSRAHPNWSTVRVANGCEKDWSGWLRQGNLNHDGILDYVVKIHSPSGSGFIGLVSSGRIYTVYDIYLVENPEDHGLGAVEGIGKGQSAGVAIGECESSGAFFRFTGRGFVLE